MAFDSCHNQIVNALEKAGWELGSQLFYVLVEDFAVFPDIQAQQMSKTGEEIIVVEVKCFADERSDLDELYRAIGQCLIYRSARVFIAHSAFTILNPMSQYRLIYGATSVFLNAIFRSVVVSSYKSQVVSLKSDSHPTPIPAI